ncbi:MAG: translation initiation factor IF-6 [Candidatus Aenigmarchaeota archaeon]|nr:translation initiation factor IF-6 [Candidatus Aenigmarchaeota archaeon]
MYRTNFQGDYNIGLHGFASDAYCLLGMKVKSEHAIGEKLHVKPVVSSLLYTSLVSLFATGNSHGIVVPKIAEEYELHALRKLFNHVLVLDTRYTALGNLLLMNDRGVLVSPLLRRNRKELADFFGIPAAVTTIAGLSIIGSAAVTTNRGCLAHPKLKPDEKNAIKETLAVDVDIGTVSFGSPYVRSGIIANSHGVIVSNRCSGPELGRINDVLGEFASTPPG